ncbi:MAG: SDR family oxidoreductase [Burkholderiales bacterium]|nr:SDR family oxidoreductase [Burkholderiales bacterium]
MEFASQRVLITGAARGIGLAVAQDLAALGARLVIADLDGNGADAAAAAIRAAGGDAVGHRCDVSSDAEVASLAAAVQAQYGGIDLLVNNAVAHPLAPGRVDAIDLDRWTRALDINVLGYVRMLRAFVPGMIERGRGHVVITSSSLAILPNKATAQMLPYITSKGALLGLAYGLSYDLPPRGVGVTLFCPGLTSTREDGGTKIADLGFLDGVPKSVTQPATTKYAAGVLIAGLRSGSFLVCSQPGYAESIRAFAAQHLDPRGDFQ